MNCRIHPTAVVEASAEIGEDCVIGPFCRVGPEVKMGRGNILHSHVVVDGRTEMGEGNEVFPFACLGKKAQDLKLKGEGGGTRLGSHNTFREYVTVNGSTSPESATIIGNRCFLLSYSHIAHDCRLGDAVIISTDSKLSGHVTVGDHAAVNAKTGAVQFVRIGRYAFTGGLNKIAKDILPFCICDGIPAENRIVNKVGMERAGFPPEIIRAVREALRIVLRSGLTGEQAVAELRSTFPEVAEVREIATFIEESRVGIARPRASRKTGG